MPTVGQWEATWQGLGVPSTPALRATFEALVVRYSESHRKYHTLRHLDECFARLGEIRPLAEHPAEVEAAIWFTPRCWSTSIFRSSGHLPADSTSTSCRFGRSILGCRGSCSGPSAGRFSGTSWLAPRFSIRPRSGNAMKPRLAPISNDRSRPWVASRQMAQNV